MQSFREKLAHRWAAGHFVCVGLDPKLERLPDCLGSGTLTSTILRFNVGVINATKDLVCAYKPNSAFYEAYGAEGIRVLGLTIEHINNVAPDVPVILDAKRADIGNTNLGYETSAFEILGADALTVNPYFGGQALEPFLRNHDKGIIVLCRTSNPGAGELQDLMVGVGGVEVPLYQHVAKRVVTEWDNRGNCVLVVGATCPEELEKVREIAPNTTILIPGVGTQGGDLKEAVLAGRNSMNEGFIINASSSILYAGGGPGFAEAARKETERLHDNINLIRMERRAS